MATLYDYTIKRYARDASGLFTRELRATPLRRARRKFAEYAARDASRARPLYLVTLTRGGVILSHFLNGRAVKPETLVADAGSRAVHV